MTAETKNYQTDDDAFVALVAKQRAEYEKLSNAKLMKKIRHLRSAEGRMTLTRNANLMAAFRAAAVDVAVKRIMPNKVRVLGEQVAPSTENE